MPAARLITRHRHNVVLLVRFAMVGASGVLVNLITLILVKRLGPGFEEAVVGLPIGGIPVNELDADRTDLPFVTNVIGQLDEWLVAGSLKTPLPQDAAVTAQVDIGPNGNGGFGLAVSSDHPHTYAQMGFVSPFRQGQGQILKALD